MKLRRLLILGLVLTWLVVPLSMSATVGASDSEPTFSAASVVIDQTGTIGQFAFPEAPSYSPVQCESDALGNDLYLKPPGYLMVGGIASFNETAIVTAEAFQRLTDGSYASALVWPIKGSVTVNNVFPVYVSLLPGFNLPVGPDYVYVYQIDWYAANGGPYKGTAWVAYSLYQRWIDGSAKTFSDASICGRLWSPSVTPSATSGIVGSKLNFTIQRYPLNVNVPITWDGKTIGSVITDSYATGVGSMQIPAAPMGPHTVHWKYGHGIRRLPTRSSRGSKLRRAAMLRADQRSTFRCVVMPPTRL
jgi:hypothetical protein